MSGEANEVHRSSLNRSCGKRFDRGLGLFLGNDPVQRNLKRLAETGALQANVVEPVSLKEIAAFVGFWLWSCEHFHFPLGCAHFNEHVGGSELVRNSQCACRVIVPFTVHDKSILVCAGRKLHFRSPYSIFALRHRNGFPLPLRETSGELDTQRTWRAIGKQLFDLFNRSIFHNTVCVPFHLIQLINVNSHLWS